jgi:uncharacterized membrane protein
MLGAGLYDWLKFFHILMAIVWVGGALGIQLVAVRLIRTSDPYALRAFSGAVEWIGNRVFLPASVILLGLGIWMVVLEPAWTFAQFWVLAAFAMFGYSILSGALYLGPQSGKLKKMYDTEGPDAPGAPELIRKLFLFSRIELGLLVLIVADMVLKPGALTATCDGRRAPRASRTRP